MKYSKLIAAAALAFAAPAFAQDAGVAVGATVYGPQGGEVGVIERVDGDVVVLNTGNNMATLPANVFGAGENGPLISMTREQLDQAIDEAEAQAEAALVAALVPGAELYSVDGIKLGTVESLGDEGAVIVAIEDHGPVTLNREQMATNEDKLMLLATAEQLRAALGGQQGG